MTNVIFRLSLERTKLSVIFHPECGPFLSLWMLWRKRKVRGNSNKSISHFKIWNNISKCGMPLLLFPCTFLILLHSQKVLHSFIGTKIWAKWSTFRCAFLRHKFFSTKFNFLKKLYKTWRKPFLLGIKYFEGFK